MARRIRRLPRCQNRGCQARVERAVTIELPAAWLGIGLMAGEQALVMVQVGLCPRCAREVERRARLLEEGHRRFGRAMAVIDEQTAAQRRNAELQVRLLLAAAANGYLRDLAAGAEHELEVVRHERDVLRRAYLRLLRRSGSDVSSVADALRDLGLPA